MNDNEKKDVPQDPVNGPVVPAPTEQKPETEIAQEDGRVLDTREGGGPVVVAKRQGMFGSSMGNDTTGYGGLERKVLFPGEAQRPYGGWFDKLADDLAAAVDKRGEPRSPTRSSELWSIAGN